MTPEEKGELRELRAELDELEKDFSKRINLIRRRISLHSGGPKPVVEITPFLSPLGLKSKCVELSKKRKK
jgi:hypothetical protein